MESVHSKVTEQYRREWDIQNIKHLLKITNGIHAYKQLNKQERNSAYIRY